MISMKCLLLMIVMVGNYLALSQEAAAQNSSSQHNMVRQSTITPTNVILNYENPSHTFEIQYPHDWKLVGSNDKKFELAIPSLPQVTFSIDILPSNFALVQLVGADIISYKQRLTAFKLVDSAGSTVAGSPAYKVVYSYLNSQHLFEVMRIWTKIANQVYFLAYSSESQEFSTYLPVAQQMIDSLHIQAPLPSRENALSFKGPVSQYSGLRVSSDPYAITVNPETGTIYVSNLHSNTISVVDGSTDKLLASIYVGNSPSTVVVNPSSEKLYVTNSGSNTVSVVDTLTNKKTTDIMVGSKPIDLALDPFGGGLDSFIFVANSGDNTVSVLDGLTNRLLDNFTVGNQPDSIFVNPLTKTLYVANALSNSVSVFDYGLTRSGQFQSTKVSDISVGSFPISMSLNLNTNILYVLNELSGSISIINGSTYQKLSDMPVGSSPADLYINPYTHMVDVANYGSGTISIIDGLTRQKITDIPVGGSPFALTYNPITRITYVTDQSSHVLTEISNNTVLAGISFNVKPPNSGNINCNQEKMPSNHYVRYAIGTALDCKVAANAGYAFSSWTSDLNTADSNSTETTFKVFRYGNLTANFVVPFQISFPKQYWEGLYVVLLSVIIPAVASWSIPAILGWLSRRSQRQNFSQCMAAIIRIHDNYLHDNRYLKQLEEKRNEIADILTNGKITESQYGILNEKISYYENEVERSQ